MTQQILEALRMPWPSDWTSLFGSSKKPIVEVGFGNGRFLKSLAQNNPHANIIGLEISNRGLTSAAQRLERAQIQNVYLIRARAYMFFWLVCKPSSICEVIVNFPDPWPKDGHSHRRLIGPKFIRLISSRLEPGGRLKAATDDSNYASDIRSFLMESPYFEDAPDDEEYLRGGIQTKYEQNAVQDGRQCEYMAWKRNDIAFRENIAPIQEIVMPHVVIRTSHSLEEIGRRFMPTVHRRQDSIIRFIDLFHSQLFEQALVDTYIIEGELEQRVMLMIKRKGENRYLIALRETGFPRPTPATHLAAMRLAEKIISMDEQAEIVNHNLKSEIGQTLK
ncbi:MAG: tRNA (guanosine(46)-N7)-methyltransferase TrmB [Candidatus Promineifilaceae bacterium]